MSTETEVVGVHGNTVGATHIFDGEEVVTGGDDGQVYIATFASAATARLFVEFVQHHPVIYGERRKA